MWEYLDESAARLALATGAMRASGDTLYEDKLRALAGVLTYGLTDDAHLDMAALYVDALHDLESYHVRVLAYFETRRRLLDDPYKGVTDDNMMGRCAPWTP